MTNQGATHWRARPVIEKDFHAEMMLKVLRSFNRQALLGMAQYHFDMLARHSRKPFKKIINSGAPFEIFE
jgi:hypothetical protein